MIVRQAREYPDARRIYLDSAEGVLIKRSSHRANIVAAILALAIAAAAPMFGRARAQSSSPSVPPPPKQSTVQAPAQPAPAAPTPEGPAQVVRRTVTVTFDYDFSKYPPCSAKATKKCIQQFNVYEVSAPTPIFLFTVPVPVNAKGMVNGISGSSPNKRVFFTGPHRFGVSAKMAAPGGESDPYQCMVFAQVLPDDAAAPAPAPSSSSPQK